MPVFYESDGLVGKLSIQRFMPIDELNLKLFKGHLEYLVNVENEMSNTNFFLFQLFEVFEMEFSDYFRMKNNYKYPMDIAHDMDAIILGLDTIDFAKTRLNDAKKYIHQRIVLIAAVACKRALDEWNQPFDKTFEELDLDDEIKEEVLTKAQQLK